ncbi:hypothetical protein CTA2_1863 [Colletotrichum tanaceti]|uniref:Uncharacterized protein n=1 Tax=Colletotrichum tanaceti TaxID=1306861 RepID=A0A4U6XJV6_9PEZI|nr:hypothetical protein CTA2_1863 [Colletotrichum tanaceti]TKW56161.1 hypothetical protein CTA1_2988 [Colletotrichum tanaceti]
MTHRLYSSPPEILRSDVSDFDPSSDLKSVNRIFENSCNHHIRVYIFADRYDVAELQQSCVHRIQNILLRVKLSEKGNWMLFDMIAFIFGKTMSGARLRKLFVQLCVANCGQIQNKPGYKDGIE